MVKSFKECVRSGGKVITKKGKNGSTYKACVDDAGNYFVENKKFKNKNKNKVELAKEDDLLRLKDYFDSIRV